MKADLHDFCAHLMGALLNGMTQGILVSALVYLVLRCRARANAATRHAVWYATLLLLVFLIPTNYLLDQKAIQQDEGKQATGDNLFSQRNDEPAWVQLAGLPDFGSNPGAASIDSTPDGGWSDVLRRDPPTEPMTGAEVVRQGNEDAESDFDVTGAAETSSIGQGISAGIGQVSTVAAEESGGGPVADGKRHPSVGRQWPTSKWLWPIVYSQRSATGAGVITALTFVWFFISAGRLVALFRRLRQLRKISDQATSAREGQLTDLFRRLLTQAKVRRRVSLRITGAQRSPIVLGFLRPTILLPAEMISDLAAAEPVLRHELAHVRRYDDWANLIQHLVQVALFFHPAVLWIGKRLTLEREIACDDYVLQEGGGRRTYALLLANVAERIQLPAPVLAPGVSHSHSQLQERISMILNSRRNSSPNLAKATMASIVSLAVALAALSLYAAPRVVLAASSADGTPTLRNGSAVLSTPGAPAAPAAESADAANSSGATIVAADGPSAAAVGIDPGPKFKPEAPGTDPAAPGEMTPEPPEPPSVDFAPRVKRSHRVAKAGKPGKDPQPADLLDPAEDGDSSVDARLRKLEKMVKALMDQQNPKRSHSAFEFNEGANQNFNNDQEQRAKLKDQAKRAMRDRQARIEDEEDQGKGQVREVFEKQLDALRKARENLGRELEKLDRQIEKLQQQQQRGERDRDQRRGDAVRERMNADVSVTPEVAVTPDVVISPDVVH